MVNNGLIPGNGGRTGDSDKVFIPQLAKGDFLPVRQGMDGGYHYIVHPAVHQQILAFGASGAAAGNDYIHQVVIQRPQQPGRGIKFQLNMNTGVLFSDGTHQLYRQWLKGIDRDSQPYPSYNALGGG